MLNWKFCADDVLMHCLPHLLAYLHFRRNTAGVEGMRLFPIFVLLERQERGFFFNFHHWPSLNMPETKSGQVNTIGCALALVYWKAQFIFTPKIAEIFSMFNCYISVGLPHQGKGNRTHYKAGKVYIARSSSFHMNARRKLRKGIERTNENSNVPWRAL